MNIRSTVYPETKLELNEWMEQYRVSSQVPKYDGIERAAKMMREYDSLENRTLFKRIVQKLNTNHNHEEDQHRGPSQGRIPDRIR